MNNVQEKYADLVLTRGLALKRGQSLFITCAPQDYDFARLVASRAYAKGALQVDFSIRDDQLLRVRMDIQSEEEFAKIPDYLEARYADLDKNDWAILSIDTVNHFMEGCEVSKSVARQKAIRAVSKEWHDNLDYDRHAWCIICVPSPSWAEEVLGKGATEEELWQLLMPILRLDTDDPCAAWDKETVIFDKRCAYLNSLGMDHLHYTSSTCDLTVGLHTDAMWMGGPGMLPDGRRFYPNLPTAEVFCTPDKTRCSGYVTSTKPVPVYGIMTENVRFTFKDGKVVAFSAKKGAEAIERLLSVDEGSSRIGEIALVDEDSPIAKAKRLFSSILYDENASCHMAIGTGFPCFRNLGDADFATKNGNKSSVHVDFMVGSQDLDIEAVTATGKHVMIMEKGHFIQQI